MAIIGNIPYFQTNPVENEQMLVHPSSKHSKRHFTSRQRFNWSTKPILSWPLLTICSTNLWSPRRFRSANWKAFPSCANAVRTTWREDPKSQKSRLQFKTSEEHQWDSQDQDPAPGVFLWNFHSRSTQSSRILQETDSVLEICLGKTGKSAYGNSWWWFPFPAVKLVWDLPLQGAAWPDGQPVAQHLQTPVPGHAAPQRQVPLRGLPDTTKGVRENLQEPIGTHRNPMVLHVFPPKCKGVSCPFSLKPILGNYDTKNWLKLWRPVGR